jgi:hypothetical protein
LYVQTLTANRCDMASSGTENREILDLIKGSRGIVSPAAQPAGSHDNGGFPSLLSDDEFENLQLRHERYACSEYDRIDNAGTLAKRAPTDGLPESTIEKQFTHVSQQLIAMWPSAACAAYLQRLVISDRGSRQGFPPDVMEDLIMLYEINELLCRARVVNTRKSGSHVSTTRHSGASNACFDWNLMNKIR